MCTDRLEKCSEAKKWTVEEKVASRCCGFCTICQILSDCLEHEECIPKGDDYTCECKKGFDRDEGKCKDLDECSNGRRTDKYGHYCPFDARCINTQGGFICQCPVGFNFTDQGDFSSNCTNINECEDDPLCPNNLVCKDLHGSYECTCETGNIRAGDGCIPHCNPPCHSAGTCVANNTCMCPGGLTGRYCESDINECDSNHGCSEHATCINFHGGYFCVCKDGYRGNGRTCTDVNECNKGTYDCPHTTTCKNTNGSYECQCASGDCRGGCVHNDKAFPNNGFFYIGHHNCQKCTCLNGEWDDCPCQCDTNPCCKSCRKGSCQIGGQEFNHNKDFIHPNDSCKTCTCKNGEIQCTGEGFGFNCPKELLISTGKGKCPKCEVEKCTEANDRAVHNYSCTECICGNNEWTCRKKEVLCPPVTCKSTIIVGCCEVCDGSQTTTSTRILSSSSQPASVTTNPVTATSTQPDDDDDGYC